MKREPMVTWFIYNKASMFASYKDYACSCSLECFPCVQIWNSRKKTTIRCISFWDKKRFEKQIYVLIKHKFRVRHTNIWILRFLFHMLNNAWWNENLDVYSRDEKVYIWNGILWEKQSTLKKEFLPTPLLDEK